MNTKMKKKSLLTILSMVLLFGLFLIPGMKANAASGGSVYATVEKFTIGQGYLIQPTKVDFKEGDTYENVLKKLLKENGYTYDATEVEKDGYFYLKTINNADSGKVKVPTCIQKMDGYIAPNMKMVLKNKALGEGSYTSQSGWMSFVNGVSAPVSMDQDKAKDGDVVRYQFTLCGYGADLGDASMATWGGKYLPIPNRDSITKKLAIMNQNQAYKKNATWVSAYNKAITVTANLDSSEAQIKAAESKLPTANQISAWTKQQAVIKKNTPAKTTLKTVKNSGKKKAQLTWKKVSKATGYEVYQATKKAGTYKKVKTVRKNTTVTYRTKTLKKKKTYYFKIRTYRKVKGKTYYGAFSNIKKVKIK